MNWEDSSQWYLPYLWEQKNQPVENFTFWCKIHSSRYLRGLKGMLLIWNHAYSIFVSGCHSQDFNCDCILQLTTTGTRFHHINTVLQQSRYLWNVSFASFPLPPATPWCMHGNNDWIVFILDIRKELLPHDQWENCSYWFIADCWWIFEHCQVGVELSTPDWFRVGSEGISTPQNRI